MAQKSALQLLAAPVPCGAGGIACLRMDFSRGGRSQPTPTHGFPAVTVLAQSKQKGSSPGSPLAHRGPRKEAPGPAPWSAPRATAQWEQRGHLQRVSVCTGSLHGSGSVENQEEGGGRGRGGAESQRRPTDVLGEGPCREPWVRVQPQEQAPPDCGTQTWPGQRAG